MIQGDSIEYEILKEACETLNRMTLFTCRIGVRQGARIQDYFRYTKR
jgi:hypothetical protein